MANDKVKKILIFGAGGFAREVLWLIQDINSKKLQWEVLGFVDNDSGNIAQIINGLTVFSLDEVREKFRGGYGVVAIGKPSIREKVAEEVARLGFRFSTLIHPTVIMSDYIEIGEGTMICAGAILTTQVKIGRHVIINLGCTIGHDVNIDDYVNLAPGVHISGRVKIGRNSFFGTGSVTVENVSIGEGSFIGASALVTKNVLPNNKVLPLRPKRIKG